MAREGSGMDWNTLRMQSLVHVEEPKLENLDGISMGSSRKRRTIGMVYSIGLHGQLGGWT